MFTYDNNWKAPSFFKKFDPLILNELLPFCQPIPDGFDINKLEMSSDGPLIRGDMTLIWNYQQGWPSFIFHGGRTNFELSPVSFIIMGLGQLIYLLPLTLFLAIWAFFAIKRNKLNNLLIYPASFIILSFNLLYVLGAEGFPHWTMPGWMLSLPLIGILLTQKSDQFRNNVKKGMSF